MPIRVETTLWQIFDFFFLLQLWMRGQSRNHPVLFVIVGPQFGPDQVHKLSRPVIVLDQKHTGVEAKKVLGDDEGMPVINKLFQLNIHIGNQGIRIHPKDPIVLILGEFILDHLDLGPGRDSTDGFDLFKIMGNIGIPEVVSALLMSDVFSTVVIGKLTELSTFRVWVRVRTEFAREDDDPRVLVSMIVIVIVVVVVWRRCC